VPMDAVKLFHNLIIAMPIRGEFGVPRQAHG
jgi:hypothetical protein